MAMKKSPAIFVSHGAPCELIQSGPWQLAMETIGRAVKPRAVIVMSAHWRSRIGFEVGYQAQFSTIHDFSGFPEELSRFRYPARGDANLADQCVDLLQGAAFQSRLEQSRGLDHGAYVPLFHMWSKADVPVIPVAIPAFAKPQNIFRAGEILAPLRHEDVMIIGSGGMVHNLGELTWEQPNNMSPESWAVEYQEWVFKALNDRDFSALCDFQSFAPHGHRSHPTWEHFAPLLFVAGAASAWGEPCQELYSGWTYGSLSMSCVGYGKIY
jgi:4,5-DOPA dioxygenase extradiol